MGGLAVVRKRFKRLLPPFWLFGAAMVATMTLAAHGAWTRPVNLVLWIVPAATPPGSAGPGQDWVLPLWYLSVYLWLVVASPLLLRAFRAYWPVALVLPAFMLWLVLYGPGDRLPDGVEEMVLLVGMNLPCWFIGFAHRDGRLSRIPLPAVALWSAVTAAVGAWILLSGWQDASGETIGTALHAAAFAALAMRLPLRLEGMQRIKWLDLTVAFLNARAVTVYLWGNVAIFLAIALLDPLWGVLPFGAAHAVIFVGVWILLTAATLATGWMEDVAAGRRPRLLPQIRRPASVRVT